MACNARIKALLRQLQQSIPTTTRTITYDYDGLQRLTSAVESPGTNQTYRYDLAGNRTGVWVNGTRTQNLTYNAANQVSGWSYDAAGNLLSDGTTAYTYDALNRVLTMGSTSNQYNADGALVAQTVSSVTTRSTQDLAAPLSQILSNGTQRYVYGNPAERLVAQQGSSARTWYSTDALGSVRATLSDVGIPQAAASYDAWGVPETPLIGSFGFTGELQQGNDVWLRARWYGAGRGGFGSRDPYVGDAQTPYSMMPYQYAYSAPTVWTDPSGECPAPPASMGKRVICMALFIALREVPVDYTPIILHGDNRSFNSNSSPDASRGYIWINADTGSFRANMNQTGYIVKLPGGSPIPPGIPVCGYDGKPRDPVPPQILNTRSELMWGGPSAFNKWGIKKVGDTIIVKYDLVLGGILEQAAPHINGSITFYKEYQDRSRTTYLFNAYGERDGFPWAEAYYHNGSGAIQTIFQRPAVRGNPEDLNAIEDAYPYGWLDWYGGKIGYEGRKLLADKHPRKDIFGYTAPSSRPR